MKRVSDVGEKAIHTASQVGLQVKFVLYPTLPAPLIKT